MLQILDISAKKDEEWCIKERKVKIYHLSFKDEHMLFTMMATLPEYIVLYNKRHHVTKQISFWRRLIIKKLDMVGRDAK